MFLRFFSQITLSINKISWEAYSRCLNCRSIVVLASSVYDPSLALLYREISSVCPAPTLLHACSGSRFSRNGLFIATKPILITFPGGGYLEGAMGLHKESQNASALHTGLSETLTRHPWHGNIYPSGPAPIHSFCGVWSIMKLVSALTVSPPANTSHASLFIVFCMVFALIV
jgi:hypothetical protein